MKIELLSRNYTPSDKLKDIISKKVNKLDKFFEDDTKVKIVLKKTKDIETMEITIPLGIKVLRAEVSGANMYENIDLALPKLEKQIIKHHSKMKDKKFKSIDDNSFPVQPEPDKKVVRSKSYQLVPMTIDDAIEELELVGHDFYIFANKATGNVNVLYARNDGDYGLIEAVL